jgi:WhiB family redox-sensing transcriptional regulator
MMNRDWTLNARCRGMDTNLFFPTGVGVQGRKQAEAAAAICAECPVIVECRQYRDATDSAWGVWGGDIDARTRYYNRVGA